MPVRQATTVSKTRQQVGSNPLDSLAQIAQWLNNLSKFINDWTQKIADTFPYVVVGFVAIAVLIVAAWAFIK